MNAFELRPIGHVESPLLSRAAAPKQGREGSPRAWLVIDQRFSAGLAEIEVGDELLVLTWLDRAEREVLTTRVRGDPSNPLTGVFSTRSPDRPNPIGIHRVNVVSMVDRTRIQVEDLEALHMTPILDIKPVLSGRGDA
jgi:tRNA-Thr(GGU) m(6)t(6)A37 methyltransferase TsaA